MRRTNIYLTPVQEAGFRRLTAATGQSMAALVREAVNYMLAHPESFPVLQALRLPQTRTAGSAKTRSSTKPAKAETEVCATKGEDKGPAKRVAPARKAPPKVKRTPVTTPRSA